jgi:hypothetical protein
MDDSSVLSKNHNLALRRVSRRVDGGADARIGRATATHGVVNVGIIRLRVLREQRCHRSQGP